MSQARPPRRRPTRQRQRNIHPLTKACLQGLLPLLVLQRASQGQVYGGALRKTLQEFGYAISPGALYPLLHRLEAQGLCTSSEQIIDGRVRRYYEVNDEGRAYLTMARHQLADIVQDVFGIGRPEGPDRSEK